MYVYRRKCNFVCISRVVTDAHHTSIRIQYVFAYIQYVFVFEAEPQAPGAGKTPGSSKAQQVQPSLVKQALQEAAKAGAA